MGRLNLHCFFPPLFSRNCAKCVPRNCTATWGKYSPSYRTKIGRPRKPKEIPMRLKKDSRLGCQTHEVVYEITCMCESHPKQLNIDFEN